MTISTEPIGSIPRPLYLQQAMAAFANGQIKADELERVVAKATQETMQELEKTGSPVLSDGEQAKPSFVTYPLQGLASLAPDGVIIPFADGHTRQLPKLTAGPFHYTAFANSYLRKAQQYSALPIKQAVISCSAISLLYPQDGIEGYSRDQFLADLVDDAEADIRTCLNNGAYKVQIDFTEARLALKLDPSKQILAAFIDLNNQVLNRFTADEKKKIESTPAPVVIMTRPIAPTLAIVIYCLFLFQLEADSFYLEYAAEPNKKAVLESIKENLKPNQQVFLGVTNVLDPRVETAEEIRDLILEAAAIIPIEQLGTTDDCGFSPFGDDTSTAREIAFAKIRARIDGTKLAENELASS